MTNDIDITVYGASGFTGRLIAEYLAGRSADEPGFTWAMAGRNPDKLAAVQDGLGLDEPVPIIAADGEDAEALAAMAERSRVVIAAAGPYQMYGSKVLAACAETGTDYVDLCGEPNWIREMIDAHAETAASTGARIVISCGFDSMPSDLGVYLLQSLAIEHGGAPVERVKGRVHDMVGGASGGTVASMMAAMGAAASDPEVGKLMIDPFALTPGFSGPPQPPGTKPQLDEELDSWAAPFVMAVINTKTIHRTNALLEHRYGTDFQYDEMVATGPGEAGEAAAQHVAASGGMSGNEGSLKPGDGPSPEEREAGSFSMTFTGVMGDGRKIETTVAGDMDPGYGSTSKMISEAALCLLQDDIPTDGGIWTPASAMGDALIDRVRRTGALTITSNVEG